MHLNEPTIEESDSEFLNKQLTLLHRLKWRLYNLEQLSRYEKEFLAVCKSILFIACEASYLQWYSTQESEDSNWLLRITLTTYPVSLIGCSKTELGDLIKGGTLKSSREIRSCDFARAPTTLTTTTTHHPHCST